MTPTHAQTLQRLRDAFPREEFPDRTVALYGQQLQYLPPEAVARAVENMIRRSRFLPRISEVLTEIAELELNLPTTEEAWEIAERGSLRAAHPIVKEAAEHVGGRWQILHSDNIPTVRAQFRTAYERLRERTINEYRTGQARELPDGLKPLGPTMKELPVSDRIRPRPVMARLSARWAGRDLSPPTDEEKRDAIEVLRIDAGTTTWDDDGVATLVRDPLYQEAERIFAEGAA